MSVPTMKPVTQGTPAPASSSGDWDPSSMIGEMLRAPAAAQTPPTPDTIETPEPDPVETPDPVPPRTVTPAGTDGSPDIPDGLFPGEETTPPAPVVKKDEVEEPDPIEITRGSTKAKNRWAEIKAEKKALQAERDALKAELEKAKTSPKLPEVTEVLELKKQLAEYEGKIGQYDLTATRAFKTRFDLPMERLQMSCQAILKRQGIAEDEAKSTVEQMLSAKSEQDKLAIVSDLPQPVQGALYNYLSEYEQIKDDRKTALDNWKQTSLALKETESRNEEISLAQNIEVETTAAVEAARKAGNWMYAETGKGDEWDKAVKARIDTVKGILHVATPQELTTWVVEGLTAKPLRDLLMRERARTAQLTKELQQRVASRPPIGGRGGSTPPKPAADGEAMTPEAFIASTFG